MKPIYNIQMRLKITFAVVVLIALYAIMKGVEGNRNFYLIEKLNEQSIAVEYQYDRTIYTFQKTTEMDSVELCHIVEVLNKSQLNPIFIQFSVEGGEE